MPASARQIWLTDHPEAEVRPEDFRLVEVPLPPLRDGEVLVRNTFTSVDPALRLQLRRQGPDGYFSAFALNAPMDGIMAVGEVVESRAEGFAPGDAVTHGWGWRDLAVVPAGVCSVGGVGTLMRIDPRDGPPEMFLGPLGNMGLTAYVGLLDGAELRDGDVVWISAAAGAVGSIAAQVAKLRGHRVIGSAGSPEKVRYLLAELGLDAAFDYHDGPVSEQLRAAAPDGIDVYFDNVGGEHLQAALATLRRWGRVAMCGAISEYERSGPQPGPSNLFQAVANDLTLRGFRASTHLGRLAESSRVLGQWLREGRLKYRQTIVEGLQHAPDALARMLAGETIGKTLVRIDG
jgi:NADPH-dependent curcumin reductase CurA